MISPDKEHILDALYKNGADNLKLSIKELPSLTLSGISKVMADVIDDVYAGKTEFNDKLFDFYNSTFHKSVAPLDKETAKGLKNNLSGFAAAKASGLIETLNQARVNADGEVLSKAEYLKRAQGAVKLYGRTMATEYNVAVRRSRMVKQWESFQQDKDLYPNVEWLATRSATPRADHLDYAGRVWSMNDPFWSANFPGNLWGCKCGWRATDAPVTENSNLSITKPSVGLESNPAIDEIGRASCRERVSTPV